ncbi:MAG: S28 family serine protease [Bacteroidales bacterium]|nr:S28 family serine protease [Bacteroidales bacterium]MDD3522122.1 S28 family serine protease [Bacteroidales bacterium]MDD4030041.1 S28 family serine protease [Bacteroidales bacterium]MDD4435862.1 S28 family serine protease [Bacteroidales bacterium]MDD5733073.1 S28 family serine protease [Bacteroidales bacterium]
MKPAKSIIILALLAFFINLPPAISQTLLTPRSNLEMQLSAIEGITEVFKLESTEFGEKFRVRLRQMVNHDDIIYGFFEQQIFVMHAGYDRPTVLVTEGYGAGYAARPGYREELSRLLNANLIVVEHRYFGESVPSPRRWEFLDVQSAMTDLHKIREKLGALYTNKWIATGISKGGQTALMYRTLYPDDVDITVCYVAPLCQGVEDGRHEPFIARKAGTPEARQKVLDFQKEVLIRKDSIMPHFEKFCDTTGLHFTRPVNEIFDYCVLEYSFAFWQWGTDPQTIPGQQAPDAVLLAHLLKIASPDYFVRDSPIMPFFIQAARELGYYGYDTTPFRFKVSRTRFVPEKEKKSLFGKTKESGQEPPQAKDSVRKAPAGKWVTKNVPAMELKSAKRYLKDLFLPDFYKPLFHKSMYRLQRDFVKKTDARLVFIYGEWDPWTAAAVPDPGKPNVLYYVQPGGSHRARIATLPESMKDALLKQLESWLNE